MWNRQDQVRNFRKDRRRADEVGLEIKVSNDGEVPESSLEDLIDDEIFKELINIVVDVFSHKSEKCLLTFELPSQSDGLATVSSNSLCTSNRLTDRKPPMTDLLSHLKCFESLPPRTASKHNRNLKLPIIKPSKHSHKKVLDKRLNPIVQTVLHPKRGFTDLEALFKVRHRSSSESRWQCSSGNERHRTIEEPGNEENIADEWGRQAEVQIPKPISTEDFGKSNERSYLYNQFHEVIDILKTLMDTYNEKSHTDSHRIDYHLGEIKTHIVAIRSYLSSRSSIRSSSVEVDEVLPRPKTQKVGSFISRTKIRRRDVTVYQIATKKSLACGSQSQRDRKRKKKNRCRSSKATKSKEVQLRWKDETLMSLEDILKCYQQMKREETELVKVMLSRLGLASVETERSQSHKDVDCQIENKTVGRGCQTSGRLHVDGSTQVSDAENEKAEKLKSRDDSVLQKRAEGSVDSQLIGENDRSTATVEPGKSMKTRVGAKRRLVAKSLDREIQRDRMKCETRLTKRTIPTSVEQEKREIQNETNEVSKNEASQCCFVPEDIINQYSDIEGLRNQDGRRIIREEKVMSRIQNAAERLEHMQDLMGKKLGYLCKQKEFYQEIRSSLINSEVDVEESKTDAMKREDQSSGSQNEQGKVQQEARNATAMNVFSSYVQYPNVNLEESKDFRELLRSFEDNSSRASTSKCKSRKTKMSKAENNSQEDQLFEGKTYICNYMMEMRGCEMNLEENNSQLQLVSLCENSMRINDKANEVPGCMDSNREELDVNEVGQEGYGPNLSSVNPEKPSTHCQTDKPQRRIRKKIGRINCPRKSSCTLS